MKTVIQYSVIAYYFLLLLAFLFSLTTKKRRFYFINCLIALFLPILGGIYLGILQIQVQNQEKEVELYKKFNDDTLQPVYIGNQQNDYNAVSLTDVLLYEDVITKRGAIMQIFSGDSMNYVKELKLALADADTEVSHYASSALTDIKRKFDNLVIELGKQAQENEKDLTKKNDYVNALHSYIESGILDPANQAKYQRLFCRLSMELFENKFGESDGVDMTVYKDGVLYLNELGETAQARRFIQQLLQEFDHEIIYFAGLQLYYMLGEKENFQALIEKIKISRIQLSPEKLASFRYFIEPQNKGKETVHG